MQRYGAAVNSCTKARSSQAHSLFLASVFMPLAILRGAVAVPLERVAQRLRTGRICRHEHAPAALGSGRGSPEQSRTMRHLAILAALACADEELRLRVSIPTIDEETMHERAFAEVGTNGDVREVELVVPKGQEPEGAALKLCLREVGPGAGLVDCVVQLASHASVERILRRTPDDEPLPSLSLDVEGDVGSFEHVEGADFGEEALAFCSRVVREDRSKSIVKNCARNLKAQARRKVTQLLVDEQTDERRKAIEQAVDASLSSNPDKWKRARRRRKDR